MRDDHLAHYVISQKDLSSGKKQKNKRMDILELEFEEKSKYKKGPNYSNNFWKNEAKRIAEERKIQEKIGQRKAKQAALREKRSGLINLAGY